MLLTVRKVGLAVIGCDYNCGGTHPQGNLRQLERLSSTNAPSLSSPWLVCKLWGRPVLFIPITLMSGMTDYQIKACSPISLKVISQKIFPSQSPALPMLS